MEYICPPLWGIWEASSDDVCVLCSLTAKTVSKFKWAWLLTGLKGDKYSPGSMSVCSPFGVLSVRGTLLLPSLFCICRYSWFIQSWQKKKKRKKEFYTLSMNNVTRILLIFLKVIWKGMTTLRSGLSPESIKKYRQAVGIQTVVK